MNIANYLGAVLGFAAALKNGAAEFYLTLNKVRYHVTLVKGAAIDIGVPAQILAQLPGIITGSKTAVINKSGWSVIVEDTNV